MVEHWANFDLHLDVNLDGARLGRSLEDALRAAIRDGRLPPGTRLPASRALAADLGIARNTVADAFGQLVAEGWLSARTGAGTWVTGSPGAPAVPGAPAASAASAAPGAPGAPGATRAPAVPAVSAVSAVAERTGESGVGIRSAAASSLAPRASSLAPVPAGPGREPGPRRQLRYNLHPGVPDLSAFPRREWLAATRRALASSPDHLLTYPDPRGLAPLREALAGYLARTRGVSTDPERIVVCAGFMHGLALLAQVLGARGLRAVAVESYGLPEHRAVLSRAGLRLVPLPADAHGAVPGDAHGMPGDAPLGAIGAALLTPAHQFPLGMTLAPARRRMFAEWAADTGAVLIEDDYDGEFRYDRHPVGAMQALAPDHVVYGGTASKALAPGLRLGWLAVPERLMKEVVTAARLTGGGPDAVNQLALAELITSGGYDRQIRHARLAYRRRRDRLVAALSQAAPLTRVTGIAAGLHAIVELAPGRREAEAIASAERHGVAVLGLGEFDAGAGQRPPALVVGYATPPPHAYTTAIARLAAALAEDERPEQPAAHRSGCPGVRVSGSSVKVTGQALCSAHLPGGFADGLVDVLRAHVELLGDVLFGLQGRLFQGLPHLALADHHQGRLTGVDQLPELLDVAAGHTTPQMAAYPADSRAHQRRADNRGREQDADHRPSGETSPCPVPGRGLVLVDVDLAFLVFRHHGGVIRPDRPRGVQLLDDVVVVPGRCLIRIGADIDENRFRLGHVPLLPLIRRT
jgi:GntR family transcriptional regulator / MocR family aminotransferase